MIEGERKRLTSFPFFLSLFLVHSKGETISFFAAFFSHAQDLSPSLGTPPRSSPDGSKPVSRAPLSNA